jgi:hypothetical protein
VTDGVLQVVDVINTNNIKKKWNRISWPINPV